MLRAKMIAALAVASIGLGGLVSSAFAQEEGAAQQPQKIKTYDFSGDNIEGDLLSPDGDVVDVRSFASHSSLIRIRRDFIKEILKSAEDL